MTTPTELTWKNEHEVLARLWNPVLRRWGRVMDEYGSRNADPTRPYEYNERTVLGFLAIAISTVGASDQNIVLQEYRSQRASGRGRADLWADMYDPETTHDWTFLVEAKHLRCTTTPRGGPVWKSVGGLLDDALDQAFGYEPHDPPNWYVGAAFVLPAASSLDKRKLSEIASALHDGWLPQSEHPLVRIDYYPERFKVRLSDPGPFARRRSAGMTLFLSFSPGSGDPDQAKR